MNYLNINLKSQYEKDQNILEGLSTETLLLEISTNLEEINEKTVTAQFEEDLKTAVKSAREIFKANLKNIVAYAIEDRKD